MTLNKQQLTQLKELLKDVNDDAYPELRALVSPIAIHDLDVDTEHFKEVFTEVLTEIHRTPNPEVTKAKPHTSKTSTSAENLGIFENTTYEQSGILGKGGMGTVLQVQDTILKRSVALKMMRDGIEHDISGEFLAEAQIIAQLQHPGIIPIYEFGYLDNQPYFTMQEVRGKTFKDLILDAHSDGPPSPQDLRRLCDILNSVCDTISYAHSKGVVHRDIKPQNILVGIYGEVFVVDWGIAVILPKLSEDVTPESLSPLLYLNSEETSIVGTPAYMAPEQTCGQSDLIGAHCDVYAIGAVLYGILTASVPHKGLTDEPFIWKKTLITDEDLQQAYLAHLERSLQNAPDELRELCIQALSPNSETRIKSIQVVSRGLQSWMDGRARNQKAEQLLHQVREIESEIKKINERLHQFQKDFPDKTLERQLSKTSLYWNGVNDLRDKKRTCEQQLDRCLQNALLFSPDQPKIYLTILQRDLNNYLTAIEGKDVQGQRRIKDQIMVYCEHISSIDKELLLNTLEQIDVQLAESLALGGKYIGEQGHIEELLNELSNGHITNIVGTPGSGKSRLALQVCIKGVVAHQQKVLICNMRSAMSMTEVMRIIADQLNIQLNDDPLNQIITVLEHSSYSILLMDNLDQIFYEYPTEMSKFCRDLDSLKVICTSRKPLQIPSANIVQTPSCITPFGIEQFIAVAKQRNHRLNITDDVVQNIIQIIHHVDHNPLSIVLAASKVSLFSVEELWKRIQSDFSVLQGSLRNDASTLQSIFEWSWKTLAPSSQSILAQCSYFKDGFTLKAAESILRLNDPEAPPIFSIIEALVEDGLLQKKNLYGTNRYSMLGSFQSYAQEKWSSSFGQKVPSTNQVAQAHAEYYASIAHTLSNAEIVKEINNLVKATLCTSEEVSIICFDKAVQGIVLQGPWEWGLQFTEKLLSSDIQPHFKNKVQCARLEFERLLGHLKECRSISEEILKHPELSQDVRCDTLWNLAQVEQTESSFERASEYAEQAQKIAIELQDPKWISINIFRAFNHIKIAQYVKAKEILDSLEDPIEHCDSEIAVDYYITLSALQTECDSIDNSLSSLRKAIELNSKNFNRLKSVQVQYQIATQYLVQGDYENGIQAAREALSLSQQLGSITLTSKVYNSLGICHKHRREFEKALIHYEAALKINTKLNNRRGILVQYLNISQIYAELGKYAEMEPLYNEAIQLSKDLGDNRLLGLFYSNKGNYLWKIGDKQGSHDAYNQSLLLHEDIGHRKGAIIARSNLCFVHHYLGNIEHSESQYIQSLMDSSELSLDTNTALLHGNYGTLLLDLNRFQESTEQLKQCTSMLEQLDQPSFVGYFSSLLAESLARQGFIQEGLDLCYTHSTIVQELEDEYPIFLIRQATVLHLAEQFNARDMMIKQIRELSQSLGLPKNWFVEYSLQNFLNTIERSIRIFKQCIESRFVFEENTE